MVQYGSTVIYSSMEAVRLARSGAGVAAHGGPARRSGGGDDNHVEQPACWDSGRGSMPVHCEMVLGLGHCNFSCVPLQIIAACARRRLQQGSGEEQAVSQC